MLRLLRVLRVSRDLGERVILVQDPGERKILVWDSSVRERDLGERPWCERERVSKRVGNRKTKWRE